MTEYEFQQLFYYSPAIRLIINAVTGEIAEVNQAAINFYQYSRSEFNTLKIYDLDNGDKESVLQVIQEVKTLGKTFQLQHRLKNGEIRNVEVFANLVNIGGQKFINAIVIDITEKLIAEARLKNSQEQLALVIEGAKAGIWDWDLRNNNLVFDKQWKAILGYKEDEIANSYNEWRDRCHPSDFAKVKQEIRDYLRNRNDKFEIEYRLRHKDGSYRWILTEGKVTRDKNGVVLRWIGCNIDITKLKHAEETRLESERMLRLTYKIKRRSDFINDVIKSNVKVSEKIASEAMLYGIDFTKPLICLLIEFKELNGTQIEQNNLVKTRVIDQITAIGDNIAWDCREYIGVLSHSYTREDVKKLIDKIEKIASRCALLKIVMGVSDINAGCGSLVKGYRQAAAAILDAKSSKAYSKFRFYWDLGVSQLLTCLSDEQAVEFVRDKIEKLIEYDNEKGTNLLPTLEHILYSSNLKEAAARIFVHYKTIVFRKKRIEQILGISLDEFETRASLAVAIKLYNTVFVK